MKNFSWAKTAVTLLFATFTSAGAWAESEFLNQDEAGNFLINDADDWNMLAEYVADGNDCEGMNFKLMDNISISRPLGQQMGSGKDTRKRFAGTFDGNNKVLKITMNTADDAYWHYEKGYCSPFAYTQNVSIKDLHVTGSVTTTGPWASGLVGSGEGTTNIENCQVSVEIVANYVSHDNKYGNHGGFIGIAEGKATISNSWFDGKFLGLDYQYSAGFIGINKGKPSTLTNCLFNPSVIDIEGNNITGSCEFVHDLNGGTHTLDKAYWVSHFGEPENAQGQKVVTEVAMEIPEGGDDSYYVETVAAADFKEESENYYYIVKHNPTWEDLKNKMAAGGEIVLNAGNAAIIAGSEDEPLVVPAGKEFKLTLNGTLDRDLMLAEAKANGYVIKVEQGGTLTINGGTITGGKNTGNGGGIYNEGLLTLTNAIITDNYTHGDGGGIYNAGTLVINGAAITGNISTNESCKGAGVYVAENGSISIQGNVQIHDNNIRKQTTTVVTTPSNLYLNNPDTPMTIAGGISGSSIGVQTSFDTDFTSGLSENEGSPNNFISNKKGFEVKWNDGKTEARLSETILELANSADNSENISNFNTKVAKVILKDRTLVKDGNWNTLCLPFALSNFNGTPLQGATVMKFKTETSKFENGTLTLNFQSANNIEAGKPYIVKWNNDDPIENPEFVGVTVKNTAAMTITTNNPGDVSFVGSYNPVNIGSEDKTKLYMGVNSDNESTLYYPSGAMTIGACRAYFQLNNGIVAGDLANGVRSIVLNFDDEATGIVSIAQETEIVKDGWFSLNGMKLDKQPTTKGLYIQNGRKVIVK